MSDRFDETFDDETFEELSPQEDSGIWLSIGDLMSGLLLFFALLFVTVTIQLKQYQDALDRLPVVVLNAIERDLSGEDIRVDPDTGDVSIGDRILFDENSAELKPEGKRFLREFIPVYSDVIFSNSEFEAQVVRVIVEGHTSSDGDDLDNLKLSLNRSLAVVNYLFSDELNFKNKDKFLQKVLTSGRGELDASLDTDNPGDRKVVFRFQLKRPNFQDFLSSQ
ncbi:OmpA family protein [Baaleninema simplex]|uniref:OmpA family protein n=1 Tax=Baaleninema simplex TaxID=2862350 RepID=UPI000346CF0A|nr:OmpA family protein [Baaleninema simplex]